MPHERVEMVFVSSTTEAQARHHEDAFLRDLSGAQDHYEWIVEHQAWRELGHDSYADWWESKVAPIMRALSMRPTREIANDVLERVQAEEAELPKAQRRTQRQLAEMTGVSQRTVSRSRSLPEPNGSNVDLAPVRSPIPDPESEAVVSRQQRLEQQRAWTQERTAAERAEREAEEAQWRADHEAIGGAVATTSRAPRRSRDAQEQIANALRACTREIYRVLPQIDADVVAADKALPADYRVFPKKRRDAGVRAALEDALNALVDKASRTTRESPERE